MKQAVVVIIRNDAGQILLLERLPTDPEYNGPCFPGGKVEATESQVKALQREVREETGLEIAGITELGTLTSQSGNYLLTGYMAYLSGGRLIRYPSREHLSASWIAPSLALKLSNLGQATKSFLEQVMRKGLF